MTTDKGDYSPRPYYEDESVTIYHGDCRDIRPRANLIVTDPPYPNNAGHFDEAVPAAEEFLRTIDAPRAFVFWHQLNVPPVPLPLVAHHVWHRTNTNRPDNYEAAYEFDVEGTERPSRVFPYAVVYPGLTGCTEATGHPTQKPVKLVSGLLALRPPSPGSVVLDPFMGSGTTLVAAKARGLRCIGIDVEESYCEMAARRLSQEVLDLGGVA